MEGKMEADRRFAASSIHQSIASVGTPPQQGGVGVSL